MYKITCLYCVREHNILTSNHNSILLSWVTKRHKIQKINVKKKTNENKYLAKSEDILFYGNS